MAVDAPNRDTTDTFSGLDALELADRQGKRFRGARLWAATWPKLLALGIFVALWQAVVLSGWKEPYVLPPPLVVFDELVRMVGTAEFWQGLGTTLRRGVVGFALATAVGLTLGVAVARIRVLRAAIGSMITALQTMPSIAWFPLAILLFQLTENAIQFVVILGAAPSIANGVIAGVDYVPSLLLRAGRNMGATGIALYRHVIAPASLPSIVAGLKQGWAFAWRSLMAGELLVIIAERPSLGAQLNFARELNDAAGLLALMVVIFIIGIAVDIAFGRADRAVRERWGVADANR
ncbi:MAG TPA: ABC transporter permease [Micromonosporaceae bacterium]|nr:ABC transporter permease [Micromonosporaceae bacterium]